MYVSALLQAAALEVVTRPGLADPPPPAAHSSSGTAGTCWSGASGSTPRPSASTTSPPAGCNLWARLPDGTDLDRLVRDCETGGVWVAAGDEWFPTEPSAPYLRLGFAGPDPSGYPAAARTIEAALEPHP